MSSLLALQDTALPYEFNDFPVVFIFLTIISRVTDLNYFQFVYLESMI